METDLIDPREMSSKVYQELLQLSNHSRNDNRRRKDQYNQAVQIYTYLATWGLLRLKAEEIAMSKEGWKDVVKIFFAVLQDLSKSGTLNLANQAGLATLCDRQNMPAEAYLGLTGLGLKLAREFAFWASAIYVDVKAEAEQEQ